MSKQLKLSGLAYRRLGANRRQNLNEIRLVQKFISKEGRRNRNTKWWERWRTSRNIKTHNREW